MPVAHFTARKNADGDVRSRTIATDRILLIVFRWRAGACGAERTWPDLPPTSARAN